MTGTSCDGADFAVLELSKHKNRWEEKLKFTNSILLPRNIKHKLKEAQKGGFTVPQIAALTRDYSLWLGKKCNQYLKKWKLSPHNTLTCIHGQTIWHSPPRGHALGFSVQLFDAAIVSMLTKTTVVFSFRQSDLALGGQGAPLVPYYHWLRAVSTPYKKYIPFAIQNIGGIANLTCIAHQKEKIIAFDTGPGNALIDFSVEKLTKGRQLFDRDGQYAQRGTVNWKKIKKIANSSFFKSPPPKSTGKEIFDESFLKNNFAGYSKNDLVAQATALTAYTMAKAYVDFVLPKVPTLNVIFLAGGGVKNKTLINWFQACLKELSQKNISVLVLPLDFAPPQYLEAMAFARLGFEAYQGKAVSLACVTGAKKNAKGAAIFPGPYDKDLKKFFECI